MCLVPTALDDFHQKLRKNKSPSDQSIQVSLLLSSRQWRFHLEPTFLARIIKESFLQDGQQSMSHLVRHGRSVAWIRSVFDCAEFDSGEMGPLSKHPCLSRGGDIVTYGDLAETLRASMMKSLSISNMPFEEYNLVAESQSGAFAIEMSTDSAMVRLKRNILSSYGISRSVIDCDERGRIVVAESSHLTFCCVFPLLNSIKSCSEALIFPRSSFCVILSIPTSICVVGVSFSRDKGSQLLVWGTDDVKVYVMNDSLNAVIRDVSLDLNTGVEGMAGVVIKSAWICSSDHSLVAVACPNSLRIFSLGQAGASLQLSIPFGGVSLVDFASAPSGMTEAMLLENRYKLFVLLEDGEMQEIIIRFDNNEWSMEDKSMEHTLRNDEPGNKNDYSEHGAKSGNLVFLEQSNLLLRQTAATGVRAFLLGENCNIKGSFEFLPSKIPSTVLGPRFSHDVIGPYTHWREVGIIRRDSCAFFRVCCEGRSVDSNEPILFYMEFNESEVRIRELGSKPAGLYDVPASHEGVAVFSAPLIVEDPNPSSLISDRLVAEVTYLCVLTSNGSLGLFSEYTSCLTRPILEKTGLRNPNFFHASGRATLSEIFVDPQFQVLDFEKLKNITESPEVEFGANALAKYVTMGMSRFPSLLVV
jgi:hypothetical protein